MPGWPNLRQAHLCHSVVPSASCAGRVARGTSGTVRRRRPARLSGACGALVALSGGGGWRLRRASGTVRPFSQTSTALSLCPSWGTSGTVRPNLRQAHLCHSAVPAASCAGRVARGTSGTVRRRRLARAGEWQHGPAPRRLPPNACVPLGALVALSGQTCARPTCAIQRSHPHRAQDVLRVALVALSGGGGWRLGRASGTVRPCSQTPAALSLCPSWDAPSLARTPKLAPDPPVPFSGPSRIVRWPCCAWH